MSLDSVTRREVLRSLTLGAVVGSVTRVIPLEAADQVHQMIDAEKKSAGAYAPKFFVGPSYKMLQELCETILPADADGGGAMEAGAPEFIDLLTSENTEYQTKLGVGLKWLDSACTTRFSKTYLECSPQQQKGILDLIAYRKNSEKDADLTEAIEFFSLLRNMTADGFFTSKIGIKYLGYKGNTYLTHFSGCPPVPGV